MFKNIIKGLMAVILVFSSLFVATGCDKDNSDQPLTNAELSILYKEVALETWESLGVSDPTISSDSLLANIPDKKIETTDVGKIDNIKINANSMVGLVYMVSLLYANENFQPTNNISVFDAQVNMMGQNVTQNYVLETNIDKENNKVYLETVVTVDGIPQYSNLEINYNFAEKTLISYRFYLNTQDWFGDMALTEDSKNMWYETTEANDDFAIAVIASKTEFVNNAKNIEKHETMFSDEVQTYMDVLQKAINDINK